MNDINIYKTQGNSLFLSTNFFCFTAMDQMRRYMFIMIFLQIVIIMLITCYFSLAFNNNTMTISNNKKRAEDLNDIQNKSKASNGTPEQKVKNQNDSTVLLHLKDNQFNSDEKTKHSSIRNNSTTHGNKTFSKDMSTVQSGNKTVCAFSFDKNNLTSARNNLSRPYYLFYVNLNIQDLNLTLEQKDQSMHWQYIRKKEQFLVQLPVDFDLLTYNLLVIDKEQTTLNINVVYNHSTCAYSFQDQLESIRLLLWNELFDHNTSFYLCNRHFVDNAAREFLYNFTTIWVGYDLNCSEVSSKGGFNYILLTKDHLPLVIPLFCYFLSLQFVWIFALLDFKTDPATIHTDLDKNIINIEPCSKSIQDDQNLSYNRKDRPYGLKRFVVKILYGKYCSPMPFTINPGIRLLSLLWFFILLPFGVYRTINRYTLSNDIYKNYCQVVRTSEPMFRPKCKSSEKLYYVIAIMDMLYAAIFPLVYIIVGNISYKFFLTNYSRTCCFLPENEEDQELITKSNRVSDRINFFNYQFCKYISIEYLCKKISCNECSDDSVKLTLCKAFACVLTFFFSFVYCFFPIIPFSCCTHVQFWEHEQQSTQTNPSNEETRQANISNASTSQSHSRSRTIHTSSGTTIQQTGSSGSNMITTTTSSSNGSTIIILTVPNICLTNPSSSVDTNLTNISTSISNTNQTDATIDSTNGSINSPYQSSNPTDPGPSIIPMNPNNPTNGIPDSTNQNTTSQNQRTDSTNQSAHPADSDTNPRNPTTNQNNQIWKILKVIIIFLCHLICIIIGQYFFCLRPIISTFTFIFRSFTYFVFVVLVVRTHILNYTILIVTTLTYFFKYLHEIVNMNAEILKYIFFINDERRRSNSDRANNETGDHTKIKYIDEEMFDFIYQRLLFVRKRLHFMFQKMVIVFMYLFITIETFITNKESLTGPSFQHIVEFLLIIIGPYAISLFLKINKDDFLTDNNKTEIEKEYTCYETTGRRINEQNARDLPTDDVIQTPSLGPVNELLPVASTDQQNT